MRIFVSLLLAFLPHYYFAQTIHFTSQWCDDSRALIRVDSVPSFVKPLQYSFNSEPFTADSIYHPDSEGTYKIMVLDASGQYATTEASLVKSSEISIEIEYQNQTCTQPASITINSVEGGTPPLTVFVNNTEGTSKARAGNNTIRVVDNSGCRMTTKVKLLDLCFDVYTGISPNGDGLNDVWEIEELEDFPDVFIQIRNRYGQVVYQSEGAYTPWDGTSRFNSDLPSGSYFYQIYPLGKSNPDDVLEGVISLIR